MQESIQPREGHPFLELGNSVAKTKLHVEEMRVNCNLMTYALEASLWFGLKVSRS